MMNFGDPEELKMRGQYVGGGAEILPQTASPAAPPRTDLTGSTALLAAHEATAQPQPVSQPQPPQQGPSSEIPPHLQALLEGDQELQQLYTEYRERGRNYRKNLATRREKRRALKAYDKVRTMKQHYRDQLADLKSQALTNPELFVDENGEPNARQQQLDFLGSKYMSQLARVDQQDREMRQQLFQQGFLPSAEEVDDATLAQMEDDDNASFDRNALDAIARSGANYWPRQRMPPMGGSFTPR